LSASASYCSRFTRTWFSVTFEPYWSDQRRRRQIVIARVWTGRTRVEDYDTYMAYLEESGVAALRATPGNQGVMVLRRLHGAEAEFSVMSFWDSLDDVKAFAGEDVDAARYFPDDERYLLDFPPRLKHFEVARER
jgi:heme-degrading monooxygenase HmoA